MTTWYRTSRHDEKIEAVEVVKESDQFVTVAPHAETFRTKPYRCAKSGARECYWPTWQQAHAYLMQRTECEVGDARRRLELANSKHGNVKGMKAPEGNPHAE